MEMDGGIELNISTDVGAGALSKKKSPRFVKRNKFKKHNQGRHQAGAGPLQFKVKEVPLAGEALPVQKGKKQKFVANGGSSNGKVEASTVSKKRKLSSDHEAPRPPEKKSMPNNGTRRPAFTSNKERAPDALQDDDANGKEEKAIPIAPAAAAAAAAGDESIKKPPSKRSPAPSSALKLDRSEKSTTSNSAPVGKPTIGASAEEKEEMTIAKKRKPQETFKQKKKDAKDVEEEQEQEEEQDQKTSRRKPAQTSTATLDEYHAKPSQLDRSAGAATAAGTGSRGTTKKISTAITTTNTAKSTSKSSKHIFTATSFKSFDLHDRLISLLSTPTEHHGFGLKTATRVQSAALPPLLQSENALLCSETGSGKTLAYLLPLIQQLQAIEPRPQRSEGTRAVIVAPTRELCHQIYDVLAKLVRAFIWIVPGIVTGGEKRKSEKARFRKGVMILVGTPGRLLDHLQNTQSFEHSAVQWLILDEVDRLLDLGFENQIKNIVARLKGGPAILNSIERRKLQVMAASATLSGGIDRLGRELLGRHVRIDAKTGTVKVIEGGAGDEGEKKEGEGKEDDEVEDDADKGSNDSEEEEGVEEKEGMQSKQKQRKKEKEEEETEDLSQFTTPVQLVQQYMLVTCKLRLPALACFLRVHAHKHKTVIFVSTCDSVDFHEAIFKSCQWPGEPLPSPAVAAAAAATDNEEKRGGAVSLLGPTLPIHRLHGNIPQAERLKTFRTFSEAKRGVLFCTDVAARGLDLPRVDWIVQYDPPTEAAEYVHRVGRTARKGQQGRALLLLLPSERRYLDVLRKKGIVPSPLSLQQTLVAATPKRFNNFQAPEEVFCIEVQQRLEKAVESNPSLLALGRKAFQCFVRAYATHPKELKAIFAVRGLHLGHLAKSFALSQAPTSMKVGSEKIKLSAANYGDGEEGGSAKVRAAGPAVLKKPPKKKQETGFFSPPRQPKTQQPQKKRMKLASQMNEFAAG